MRRLVLAFAVVFAMLAGTARAACPGYSVCPKLDYPALAAINPALRAVRAQAAAAEAATLPQLNGTLNLQQLLALLGQAIANDATLSVNGTQACTECHSPTAGFASGVAALAPGGGIFPGAKPARTGLRVPQSLAYASFAPPLTYRPATQDFAGGNFRDSRATGAMTGSPAADQAEIPFTTPFEMALPDPACAVRRVLQAPYGALFDKTWGGGGAGIAWPAGTDALCARANTGGADQAPLPLSPGGRRAVTLVMAQIGQTLAAWEGSPLVSPFHAKFDAVRAGNAAFTPAETRGYRLFTGRAHCSACHTVQAGRALFTSFTSANIGVPRNDADPYLTENARAADGYVANPAGPGFSDTGLGGFLAGGTGVKPLWRAQAARFMGAFQVPTLRNTAAGAGQIRRYMHNGYFASLGTVVHFLNTRDALPVCAAAGVIGKTCWPAPEVATGIDRRLTGNLGLSADDEAAIVAFIKTLSDV